jgi:hypothetical protein
MPEALLTKQVEIRHEEKSFQSPAGVAFSRAASGGPRAAGGRKPVITRPQGGGA